MGRVDMIIDEIKDIQLESEASRELEDWVLENEHDADNEEDEEEEHVPQILPQEVEIDQQRRNDGELNQQYIESNIDDNDAIKSTPVIEKETVYNEEELCNDYKSDSKVKTRPKSTTKPIKNVRFTKLDNSDSTKKTYRAKFANPAETSLNSFFVNFRRFITNPMEHVKG